MSCYQSPRATSQHILLLLSELKGKFHEIVPLFDLVERIAVFILADPGPEQDFPEPQNIPETQTK
jgi:hypothetical protein